MPGSELTSHMKSDPLLQSGSSDGRILGSAWQMLPIVTRVGNEGDGGDGGVWITGMTFQYFSQSNGVRCSFEPGNFRPRPGSNGLTFELDPLASDDGTARRYQPDLKWLHCQVVREERDAVIWCQRQSQKDSEIINGRLSMDRRAANSYLFGSLVRPTRSCYRCHSCDRQKWTSQNKGCYSILEDLLSWLFRHEWLGFGTKRKLPERI